MDQKALAALLFPDVTETPEDLEARYPARDLPEGAVVTRMAPSPTGFVHLGNLVQGLVAERMQIICEAFDISVVQRGIDLVEHTERCGAYL